MLINEIINKRPSTNDRKKFLHKFGHICQLIRTHDPGLLYCFLLTASLDCLVIL